jgi:hypothetical protein
MSAFIIFLPQLPSRSARIFPRLVTHNPDLLQLVLSGSTVTPTQTNEIKLTQIRSHAGSQRAGFEACLEQEGI